MKKIFILSLTGLLILSACSRRTEQEKEFAGIYSALPYIAQLDTTSLEAKIMQLHVLSTRYEMDFKKNGKAYFIRTLGDNSHTEQVRWWINADTLFIRDSIQNVGNFLIKHDTTGKLRLDGGFMEFILTRQ